MAVTAVPESYEDRLIEMFPGAYRYLRPPLALYKAICPTGFGSPAMRSPKKAPLKDLSVCYPRLRQEAFGMYMPRFHADVQMQMPKRR